jgi:hypothetical protein
MAAHAATTTGTPRTEGGAGWQQPGRFARAAPSIALFAFAAVISTGSVFHWSWTGFNKNDQLWDLLHVLVLPVVLATLPL